MDAHSFEMGDENNGDVILRIICANGVEYEGNPIYLHSHVLNKSKFFQARISERWVLHISPPEIKLTVLPNGVAENYIKCIRLMYSSYKGKGLHFSSVNDALDIFPIASELLFEEGIQACMHYLEAVPWTPQETLKIKFLLSSLQVSVSSDLSTRLGISKSSFNGELELLKKKLPEMFSTIWKNQSLMISLSSMRLTIEQHLIENFQGNALPAVQDVCRDAIMNEFSVKIECIKNGHGHDSVTENLLWLIDLTKLCNIGIFEITFKMFVEDSQLANILLHQYKIRSVSCSYSYSSYLLQILLDRYTKGLIDGDIIVPKSSRICFLRMWVPVMAYHICNMAGTSSGSYGLPQGYPEKFVRGVTKVVGTLPLDDQKALFMFWANPLEIFGNQGNPFETFGTRGKETFQWWMNAIWLAVTNVNGNGLRTE
ncbi:BTB/POZ domain-containing protein At1g63850 [Cryptomeria japonica]|uniref:BTB/POZ domain-containing protein At1g63850 n=1 Tax=Cryptomeria japonica TaxID=3369 RepID=UPI0025AB7912|nr:BTB/POZ domain-containing protein At1g63850 [Cryptomeria japonica]XP_057813598.1 BTB/POZ domain-containing protein At1g63850 [Cryptomeria japonica]XP_057813599.1 BTB/POZ domain-containing protein At1g63850 [Cryptomeria japonica]